jgi:hypothetical protein
MREGKLETRRQKLQIGEERLLRTNRGEEAVSLRKPTGSSRELPLDSGAV